MAKVRSAPTPQNVQLCEPINSFLFKPVHARLAVICKKKPSHGAPLSIGNGLHRKLHFTKMPKAGVLSI